MNIKNLVFLLSLLVAQAGAQSVVFDFENATVGTSLPLSLTVGGITANFSSTGLGGYYIQQPQNTIGVIPAGFSGNCLNPSSIYAADLHVGFSKPLTAFSILYAPQELACDNSATVSVTAYLNGSPVGTNSTNATVFCTCTWASQTLAFSSAHPFDSVVVHYVAPGPGCQDYGPIFVADNMIVTPAPPPIVLTNPARLTNGAFQFAFTNTASAPFTVYGTTNLTQSFSNWTTLVGVIESPPGQFLVTDAKATNSSQRYYRVSSP
jgi:hypothetical protein